MLLRRAVPQGVLGNALAQGRKVDGRTRKYWDLGARSHDTGSVQGIISDQATSLLLAELLCKNTALTGLNLTGTR
jgi:hypothetical protein